MVKNPLWCIVLDMKNFNKTPITYNEQFFKGCRMTPHFVGNLILINNQL